MRPAIPVKDGKVNVFDNAGRVLSGSIINVIGDFIEFTCGIKSENAGAPLLNDDLCVVGIYNGLWDPSNESAPKLIRQQIFKAY